MKYSHRFIIGYRLIHWTGGFLLIALGSNWKISVGLFLLIAALLSALKD